MADFELKIMLDEEDVSKLNAAGQRITIVKACSTGGSEEYNLSWVNFRPMPLNRVSWSTAFAVYASDIQVQNGAKIESIAQKSAKDRFKEYFFNENNVFDIEEKEGGAVNFYYVKNSNTYQDSYTFGLAQSVQINSKEFSFNPINAVKVFRNQNASFNPIEKIKVYMEANGNDGKVISQVTSDALLVDFTKKTKQMIKFDSLTSTFVMG